MIIVRNNSKDLYEDVFQRIDLSGKSKLLLLYLLMRGSGEFHFSPTRIAISMGGSRQTVRSALMELERNRFLTKEHIIPAKRRYLYRLTFPITHS